MADEKVSVVIEGKDSITPELTKIATGFDGLAHKVDNAGNIIKEKASVVLERTNKLKQAAENVNKAVETAPKSTTTTWGELTKGLKDMSKATGDIVPGMGAASTAVRSFSAGPVIGAVATVAALTTALIKLGTSAWQTSSDFAQSINDMSNKTGMTGEVASQFIEVGKVIGMSASEMGQSMSLMSRNANTAYEKIQKIGVDVGVSTDKFTKWGIAITDTNGQLLKAEDIYNNIRIRHQQMADGAEKTAMEMEIFGRSGTRMKKILDASDSTIQNWTDRLRNAGMIMNGDVANGFEEVEQRGRLFDEVLNGLWNTIGIGLLPVMDKLINLALEITDGFNANSKSGNALKDTINGISKSMTDSIDSIEAMYSAFKFLSNGIAKSCEQAQWFKNIIAGFGNIKISDSLKSLLLIMPGGGGFYAGLTALQAMSEDFKVDPNDPGNMKYGTPAYETEAKTQTGMQRTYVDSTKNLSDKTVKEQLEKTNNLVDKMRAQIGVIPFYLQELDPKTWGASDTGCVYSVGLALDGTPFAGVYNTSQLKEIATQTHLLRDPNTYTAKPGDVLVGDFGSGDPEGHAVMKTESGGTIQNGFSHKGVYEKSDVAPEDMANSIAYIIETSTYSNQGTKGLASISNAINKAQEKKQQQYNNALTKAMEVGGKIDTGLAGLQGEKADDKLKNQVAKWQKVLDSAKTLGIDVSTQNEKLAQYEALSLEKIDRERINKRHDITMDELDVELMAHEKNVSEINKLQSKELDSYKAHLEEKLANDKLSEEQRLELRKKYAELIQQQDEIASKSLNTSWTVAANELKNQTYNFAGMMTDMSKSIDDSILSSMQNWIGGEESLGDRIIDLWKNVANSVVNLIVKIAMTNAILKPLNNSLGNLFGNLGMGGGISYANGGISVSGSSYSSSLLSSSFGSGINYLGSGISIGSFAGGGYAPAGLKVIGEQGIEVQDTATPSRIYSNKQLREAMGGGNGGNVYMTVNTPNADSFKYSRAQIGSQLSVAMRRGKK